MRHRLRASAVFSMLLLFSSCGPVKSLFPLFLDSDKVFDATLLGEWRELPDPNQKAPNQGDPKRKESSSKDENARWFFSKNEDGLSYDLSVSEPGKKDSNRVNARLVRLGDALFVDLTDEEQDPADTTGSASVSAIPAHIIGRIRLDKNEMTLSLLDEQWVSNQVDKGNFPLAQVKSPDGEVLFCTTEELRKFVSIHADDKEAFSFAWRLARVK